MAKRLRDTARRKLPSYQKLSFKAKGIITYLEDNCDSAGLWPANFELASMELGLPFTETDLRELLDDRVWRVNSEYFFIKTFFEEQYAEAKDTFNAKKCAIEKLKSLGVIDSNGCFYRQSTDTQPTVPPPSTDGPIILDYIKSIKEGGLGETKTPTPPPETVSDAQRMTTRLKFDLGALFDQYPNHRKRSQALHALSTQIKTQQDYDAWLIAIRNYAKHCETEKLNQQFILTFPSFVREWAEWRDWKPSKSNKNAAPLNANRPIRYEDAGEVIKRQEAARGEISENRSEAAKRIREMLARTGSLALVKKAAGGSDVSA